MGQRTSRRDVKEGWNQKLQKIEIIEEASQKVEDSKRQFKLKLHLEEKEMQFEGWKSRYDSLTADEEIKKYIIWANRIQKEGCGFCAQSKSGSSTNLYFDPFGLTLQHHIQSKKENLKYFSEQQLWYLLLKLTKIAAFFEVKGLPLANIHPKNIIFCNQDSNIKLFSIYSSPSEPTSLERIKFSKHDDSYLAPEEIEIINPRSPNRHPTFLNRNKHKSDLFNIGLSLISAALLRDCYFIYDRHEFVINQQRFHGFKELLQAQHQRYSPLLIKIVLEFVQIDSSKRKTPLLYYSLLKKYEQKILEFELINDKLQMQLLPSPLVINYADKISTSKETKYLTLSKDFNTSKSTKESEKMNGLDYCPGRINRKLFS